MFLTSKVYQGILEKEAAPSPLFSLAVWSYS